MSSSKSYKVEGIKHGNFVMYAIASQAAESITVKISDDQGTPYVEWDSNGERNPMTNAELGSFRLTGEQVTVEVTTDTGTQKANITNGGINISDGTQVGYNWICTIEDQADNDFNDAWITLTGWAHEG